MGGWQPQRVKKARAEVRKQKAWALFVIFLVGVAYNVISDPTAGTTRVNVPDLRGASKYQFLHSVSKVVLP
jgi:hypothetical protein